MPVFVDDTSGIPKVPRVPVDHHLDRGLVELDLESTTRGHHDRRTILDCADFRMDLRTLYLRARILYPFLEPDLQNHCQRHSLSECRERAPCGGLSWLNERRSLMKTMKTTKMMRTKNRLNATGVDGPRCVTGRCPCPVRR